MQTLLLDTVNWDLIVDASGDIAVASDPYSQAQDAASAVRAFQGECYYDTTVGIPYWTQVLGKHVPVPLLKALIVSAAITVPGVVSAQCFISSFKNRQVGGQIQIINSDGNPSASGF